MSSIATSVFANNEDEIPLYEDSTDSNPHRTEQPVFRAEKEDANTVLVLSDRATSFDVCIFSQGNNEVQYQGSTEQGVLHLTNAIPTGAYIIEISHNGETLKGQFEIE